jgi:hypothetical protein
VHPVEDLRLLVVADGDGIASSPTASATLLTASATTAARDSKQAGPDQTGAADLQEIPRLIRKAPSDFSA